MYTAATLQYDGERQAMSTPGPESSVNLLMRAQAGDSQALDLLFGRYLPRLRRWARGRLPAGARTLVDTGDLVQEAMISALRHLESLEVRGEGALLAYLRQSVNNRIIDLHRRAGRRPLREEMSPEQPAASTSPLEAAIGAEALQRYEAALARLSEDDQQAIMLRVEFGCDYHGIATELDKPSDAAARMAVKRALARLAQEMSREG